MSRPAPVYPSAKTPKRALPDRRRASEIRESQELREFMAEPEEDGADPGFKERLRAELRELVRERFSRR